MNDQRTPQQVKELQMRSLVDAYEKNNRTVISDDAKRKLERLVEREVLPQAFDRRK